MDDCVRNVLQFGHHFSQFGGSFFDEFFELDGAIGELRMGFAELGLDAFAVGDVDDDAAGADSLALRALAFEKGVGAVVNPSSLMVIRPDNAELFGEFTGALGVQRGVHFFDDVRAVVGVN